MDEEEQVWNELLEAKGRRAARLERERFSDMKLRLWYAAQGWPDADTATFKQLCRSYRHSCHNRMCTMERFV